MADSWRASDRPHGRGGSDTACGHAHERQCPRGHCPDSKRDTRLRGIQDKTEVPWSGDFKKKIQTTVFRQDCVFLGMKTLDV